MPYNIDNNEFSVSESGQLFTLANRNPINIENIISSKERLQNGIFFTAIKTVEEIQNQFDFSKINTVIDTAAGSCNFLINLAKKFPDKKFYGIEKHADVYKETLKKVKQYSNIQYFLGDVLFDKFDIPFQNCDLYLGNPPFINFADLEDDYKKKIKPLWKQYFKVAKGFQLLLGESRGDISQLIFYYTIKNYLKDNAQFGVILPNSLLKGNEASAEFRTFQNINVSAVVDISLQNAFLNTNRESFYILGKKGGYTKFPLEYKTQNKIQHLHKVRNDLITSKDLLFQYSDYTARQGVNTLGANKIFFFTDKVNKKNMADGFFHSKLIHPLYKSSDVNKWNASPSYKILMPYSHIGIISHPEEVRDNTNMTFGKIIDEEKLKNLYLKEYNYLLENKDILQKRKSRFAKKIWYALFGIGTYTFSKYKVIWRALGASKMTSAVIEKGIPNQAMHCYISTESKEEAHYICAIMNSEIYNKQLLELNSARAKSFAQPSTIKKIYIPLFDKKNTFHDELSKLSLSLHKFAINKEKYSSSIKELEKSVNKKVEKLYKTINSTIKNV